MVVFDGGDSGGGRHSDAGGDRWLVLVAGGIICMVVVVGGVW